MTGSILLLATTIGSALLIGFLPVLLSRMRPALAAGLGVPETALDRLKTGYLLSLIPLMIAAGWFVDRVGAKEVLFAGILLAALGIAALGLRPTLHSLFWVVLILGLAASCLTCAGLTLMPLAFWGQPNETAASLNLGFIFVGLGALGVPFLMKVCLKRFGFRQCLLVLALLCLFPAIFTVFTGSAEFPEHHALANPSAILGDPVLWLAALVMFFYYPLEGSLDTWIKSYLANLGYDERKITGWHAMFWAVFLAARLSAGLYLDYRYEAWVILVLVLISAFTLGNLAGAYGQRTKWELLLVGLTLGSILPTFLGLVLSFPQPKFEQTAGTTLGILFSVGAFSSLLVQPVLARFSRGHSVQITVRVPLALALAVAVPCLILALVRQ
jgi:MFS family permease